MVRDAQPSYLQRSTERIWSMDPIDQIRSVGPHLADHFAAGDRGLETLTLTILPGSNVDSRGSDIDGIDPFVLLVVMRQRKLFDDREKLISQIQALPGPGCDTLRSAARHGPVIIINHSR